MCEACEAFEFVPTVPVIEMDYGINVQYARDRVYVGASAWNLSTGAVYVFERDAAGGWRFETRLESGVPEGELDHFGDADEPSRGNGVLAWFATDDFDALVARVGDAGAQIIDGPLFNPNGRLSHLP